MDIEIRQERPTDYKAVYALIQAAFSTAEHADGNEQDLVVALRRSRAFVPPLSLVAVADGKLVGHILFTEAKVGPAKVLVLAPLSVHPAYQRQGVGTVLIQAGHAAARALGYAYVVVLGSAAYYPRTGYVPAAQLGVEAPAGIPPENFMAIQLLEGAPPLSGPVTYAPEFGMDP